MILLFNLKFSLKSPTIYIYYIDISSHTHTLDKHVSNLNTKLNYDKRTKNTHLNLTRLVYI